MRSGRGHLSLLCELLLSGSLLVVPTLSLSAWADCGKLTAMKPAGSAEVLA
jgi:hypothetical protein